MSDKPKPSYAPVYCSIYPELAELVRGHGYALAIHGSMQRDFDLIAVPWIKTVADPSRVVDDICDTYNVSVATKSELNERPHGRIVYTLIQNGGYGAFLDIGFIIPDESLEEMAEQMAVDIATIRMKGKEVQRLQQQLATANEALSEAQARIDELEAEAVNYVYKTVMSENKIKAEGIREMVNSDFYKDTYPYTAILKYADKLEKNYE